jgi:hypothetical protein
MQSKQELEDWYSEPDRWGYYNNPEDAKRLEKIIFMLGWGKKQYKRAIDIGCGEGFVTAHLPAHEIHGLDLSDNALTRLPPNVTPVSEPQGKYDLVISTGTLYQQYDHEGIYKMIMSTSSLQGFQIGLSTKTLDGRFRCLFSLIGSSPKK